LKNFLERWHKTLELVEIVKIAQEKKRFEIREWPYVCCNFGDLLYTIMCRHMERDMEIPHVFYNIKGISLTMTMLVLEG
jgi:hypothetical protein